MVLQWLSGDLSLIQPGTDFANALTEYGFENAGKEQQG